MASRRKPDIIETVLREFDFLVENIFGELFWVSAWVTRDSIHITSTDNIRNLTRIYPWHVRIQLDYDMALDVGDSLRIYGPVLDAVISEYLERT